MRYIETLCLGTLADFCGGLIWEGGLSPSLGALLGFFLFLIRTNSSPSERWIAEDQSATADRPGDPQVVGEAYRRSAAPKIPPPPPTPCRRGFRIRTSKSSTCWASFAWRKKVRQRRKCRPVPDAGRGESGLREAGVPIDRIKSSRTGMPTRKTVGKHQFNRMPTGRKKMPQCEISLRFRGDCASPAPKKEELATSPDWLGIERKCRDDLLVLGRNSDWSRNGAPLSLS